jgi:hypothetical protein
MAARKPRKPLAQKEAEQIAATAWQAADRAVIIAEARSVFDHASDSEKLAMLALVRGRNIVWLDVATRNAATDKVFDVFRLFLGLPVAMRRHVMDCMALCPQEGA